MNDAAGQCCADIKCIALRLAQEADELEEKALLDGLTKVWNRGAIMELAARELALAMNSGCSTGVLMLDIDHFKKVNDAYGHLSGDDVLRQVASRILDGIRPTDAVGRWGGEEFLIVLPNCSADDVFAVGERIRTEISKSPMATESAVVRVTASIGCTVSVDGGQFVEMLVKAADQALYRAKNEGRNKTVVKHLSPSILSMKAVRR